MDKNTILDYVTETPGNTNRAVLGSMLDSFAGSGANLHTATLTIVGSSDTAVIGLNSYLDESTGYLDNNNNAPLVGAYTIPLYKNLEGEGGIYETSIWNNGEQVSMTSNGGVTITERQDYETGEYLYEVIITGDCTITLT